MELFVKLALNRYSDFCVFSYHSLSSNHLTRTLTYSDLCMWSK